VRRALLSTLGVLVALLAAPVAVAQAPPSVNADSYLVADGASGEMLLANDPDARLAVASITKLMTAIVVLEHARPGEMVTVGAPAAGVGESTVNLVPGEKLSVRDLLAAALIQSANDAAWALAAHVGGKGGVPAFVRLMNRKARDLGMEETTFVRPDGLDVPGHLSSAEDVLVLAREAMKRPLIRKLVRQDGGRIVGGRDLFAWNDLLGEYPGLIGVKTGHTDDAGWCQVAAARRGGLTIYAVVLGAPTRAGRNADLEELLDWGFARYTRTTLVAEGREYATAAVPFREDERLSLVAEEGAEREVRKGRPLLERVVAPAMVELPVRKGDRLGEVVVLDGEKVVARRALVAAEDLGAPGFRERAGWYAGRALAEAGDTLESVFGGFL
jgi:D-alanyl-D-alanine carboxypeptidase (penicillin-binding protein 5/6)